MLKNIQFFKRHQAEKSDVVEVIYKFIADFSGPMHKIKASSGMVGAKLHVLDKAVSGLEPNPIIRTFPLLQGKSPLEQGFTKALCIASMN